MGVEIDSSSYTRKEKKYGNEPLLDKIVSIYIYI